MEILTQLQSSSSLNKKNNNNYHHKNLVKVYKDKNCSSPPHNNSHQLIPYSQKYYFEQQQNTNIILNTNISRNINENNNSNTSENKKENGNFLKPTTKYQLAKRYSQYNREKKDKQNQFNSICFQEQYDPSIFIMKNININKKFLNGLNLMQYSMNGKNKNNNERRISMGVSSPTHQNKSQFSRNPLPSIIPQQSNNNKNQDFQLSEKKQIVNIFRDDIIQKMNYDQIQKAKDYQIVGKKEIRNYHTRAIKKRQNNNKRTQSIISISKISTTVKSTSQEKICYMNKDQVVNSMSPMLTIGDCQGDIEENATKININKNKTVDKSIYKGKTNSSKDISSMFKVQNKMKKYNQFWDLQKHQLQKIDSNPHSYVRKPTDFMNHTFSLSRIHNMNTQRDDIANFTSLTSTLMNSKGKKFYYTEHMNLTGESENNTGSFLNTTLGNNFNNTCNNNNMSLTLTQKKHISILDRVDSYRKKVEQMQKLTLTQQQKHTNQKIWPLTLRSQLNMNNYYKDYAFKKTHQILKNGFSLKGQQKLKHQLDWINQKNNHVFQMIDKQKPKIEDIFKKNNVSSCKKHTMNGLQDQRNNYGKIKTDGNQIRLNSKTCR